MGEGQDGGQDRLTTQAFVARWDPDTGERQGGPGAASCTHRSRFRCGGPFSRSGRSTPPSKGTRCDARGASRDPPRSCTPGGCSPPAADTTGGHGRPSKVMLHPVRQGTPCFARFRRPGRLRNVHDFAALSPSATTTMGGEGQKREGGWGVAGPGKETHVCWGCRMVMRRRPAGLGGEVASGGGTGWWGRREVEWGNEGARGAPGK